MVFPVQIWGMNANVILGPNDAGAAVFSAKGDPNRNAKTTIKEAGIIMTTGTGITPGERIKVQGFLVLAPTAFNALGQMTNIRVGATAIVSQNNVEGDYLGSATVRIVYN
ncbi:MAG: DUF4402 domain-containing protein [Pseudomonadota bacterium]